jgi:16S rRNA (cytidine1402-2'-O)-methyltransferase
LWIVATPIGTLVDLSPRAHEVLGQVDLVLAEDTRRTRRLLGHFGIPGGGRISSLHEHNEDRKVAEILEKLNCGRSVALVSDAGTPVLSDPGFPLVRAARKAGIRICSVPGPSSFTAALAASGQPPLPAVLSGFLPARSGPRRRRITELAENPWTLVLLLSPHRLAKELTDLASILGRDREATLLAELSKLHERAVMAPLGTLAETAEGENPRGEYIIVIGPPSAQMESPEICAGDVHAEYRRAVSEGLDRRDSMRRVAQRFGMKRREVFDVLAADPSGDGVNDESPDR